MENMPLVSVNITTYNREKVIGRCIESILKQNYPNIEIIIIDDFSTDDTEHVVKEYIKKDNRIKYHRHSENKGLSVARNSGFLASKGVYVATVDDDDEWTDSEKLNKQIRIFEANSEIGIVCSSTCIITEAGSNDKIIKEPKDIERVILNGNSLIYTTTALIKKSCFELIGGFDENLPRGIDSDFYRRLIINHDVKIGFLKDVTTNTHEYGNDRITNLKSIKSIKKDILSNEICLSKFKKVFKEYNDIKRLRKKRLIKKYLKLIYLEPSLENISRMFKAVRL